MLAQVSDAEVMRMRDRLLQQGALLQRQKEEIMYMKMDMADRVATAAASSSSSSASSSSSSSSAGSPAAVAIPIGFVTPPVPRQTAIPKHKYLVAVTPPNFPDQKQGTVRAAPATLFAPAAFDPCTSAAAAAAAPALAQNPQYYQQQPQQPQLQQQQPQLQQQQPQPLYAPVAPQHAYSYLAPQSQLQQQQQPAAQPYMHTQYSAASVHQYAPAQSMQWQSPPTSSYYYMSQQQPQQQQMQMPAPAAAIPRQAVASTAPPSGAPIGGAQAVPTAAMQIDDASISSLGNALEQLFGALPVAPVAAASSVAAGLHPQPANRQQAPAAPRFSLPTAGELRGGLHQLFQ